MIMSTITATTTLITIIFENSSGPPRCLNQLDGCVTEIGDVRKARQAMLESSTNDNTEFQELQRREWLTVLPITASTADLMMRNGMFERYRAVLLPITGVCKGRKLILFLLFPEAERPFNPSTNASTLLVRKIGKSGTIIFAGRCCHTGQGGNLIGSPCS